MVDPWTVSGGADGTIDYNKLLEQVIKVMDMMIYLSLHLAPVHTVSWEPFPSLGIFASQSSVCLCLAKLQFGCSKLTAELVER